MSSRRTGAWQRIRHSLGARLIALFIVLALAVAGTFVTGMQSVLRTGRNDFFRPLVNDYIDRLVADIGTPPDVARAQAIAARLPLRIRIEGPAVNWSSAPGELHEMRHRPPPPPPHEANSSLWRPSRMLADGHRISIRFAPMRHNESRDDLRNENRDDSPDEHQRQVAFATLGLLLLLTALAYALVRHWLRPLQAIRAGAIRYGSGDFSHPIAPSTTSAPSQQHDELGDLAQQIDRMAHSLQGMLDAKRALLLAISHELRSPLTRARLNAELVSESAARDNLLQDLAEMRDLITDLLESERLGAGHLGTAHPSDHGGGHTALNRERVDLGALIQELLAGPFAGKAIRTAIEADLPLFSLDRSRIRLLLRNLIDNACRHSPGGGPAPLVRIARRVMPGGAASGEQLVITVSDSGPGVTDEQLPHLAEAFYRPDSARQRSTGGVGLGLHLCRLVAEAHGGRLTLRNLRPGFEAEAMLPIYQA